MDNQCPQPKLNEIIEDGELKIKVTRMDGKDFEGKILEIKRPCYDEYLTVGKTYPFTKIKSEYEDHVWFVPEEKVDNPPGSSQMLLYSWPEGYSFELDF